VGGATLFLFSSGPVVHLFDPGGSDRTPVRTERLFDCRLLDRTDVRPERMFDCALQPLHRATVAQRHRPSASPVLIARTLDDVRPMFSLDVRSH